MNDGSRRGGAGPIAWDEAREVMVVVLLAAALMVVIGPLIGWLGADDGRFDRVVISSALTGVRVGSGLALVGAAVLVCTTPSVDVVPGLRTAVVLVGAVCAALGAIRIGLVLTEDSAATGIDVIWDKLRLVLSFSGPGVLLSGASAWLAHRVVPFPGD